MPDGTQATDNVIQLQLVDFFFQALQIALDLMLAAMTQVMSGFFSFIFGT